MARFGHIESAERAIQIVRSLNTDFNATITGWTLLSEALCSHFSAKQDEATDKLKRCHAIAVSYGLTELRALVSAWLSTIEFIASRPSEALAWLTQAFDYAEDTHFETLARATLVAADCLSWSGRNDIASRYYHQARDYALRDNDLGMQSIILFNSAAFSVFALVLQDAFGQCDPISLRKARLQVESVRNLDSGLGNKALSSYIPLAEAELLCIERNWEKALQQLTQYLDQASIEGQTRLLPRLIAQRTWCLANLGNVAEAKESIAQTIKAKQLCSDLDDLAIIEQRIHQSLCLIETPKTTDRLSSESAERCLKEFKLQQERVYSLIPSLSHVGLSLLNQPG